MKYKPCSGACLRKIIVAADVEGTLRTYAVGDKTGLWLPGGGATLHGVATFEELHIKGTIVAVRTGIAKRIGMSIVET